MASFTLRAVNHMEATENPMHMVGTSMKCIGNRLDW